MRLWSLKAAAIVSLLSIVACEDGTGPGSNSGVLPPSGADAFLVASASGRVRLLREDGTPVRDFAGAPGFSTEGGWSPDGQNFAYHSYGYPKILARFPMDGTPPAVLLKDWQDIYSVVVTGSATGGAVVFMGKHPDGRAGIWRINLDGTGLTPVWLVGQSLPSGPTLGVPMAISPDGKRVVWWSPDRSLTNPRIRIWSANLDGSQLYEHTGSLLLDQMNFVCWSPDGTWFGFEAERTGQDSHVYRAVGARPAKQILAGPTRERLLAVSPDGKRIAFNAIEATGWQVLLANADGTGIRPLLAGFGEAVEWSPDGEQIVAALDAPGDTSKLVIAQADGSGARMTEITNSQPSPWRPRSP